MEDGTVLVESYGWQQHLTPYFRPLLQIKQYQHFRFNALEPVVAKERSDCRDQVSAASHPSSHRWSACKAPPVLDTARQTIFLTRSGSFAMKRLWTSCALHQSQGQDRNMLSEYKFPCSCMVWTDQSSALSAVPLIK